VEIYTQRIDGGDRCPHANAKLTAVDKERVCDVSLHIYKSKREYIESVSETASAIPLAASMVESLSSCLQPSAFRLITPG